MPKIQTRKSKKIKIVSSRTFEKLNILSRAALKVAQSWPKRRWVEIWQKTQNYKIKEYLPKVEPLTLKKVLKREMVESKKVLKFVARIFEKFRSRVEPLRNWRFWAALLSVVAAHSGDWELSAPYNSSWARFSVFPVVYSQQDACWQKHETMKYSVILWLWAILWAQSEANSCPNSCTCANDGAIVDCSKRGLTRIPSNLPRNTVTL